MLFAHQGCCRIFVTRMLRAYKKKVHIMATHDSMYSAPSDHVVTPFMIGSWLLVTPTIHIRGEECIELLLRDTNNRKHHTKQKPTHPLGIGSKEGTCRGICLNY
ncbi:hypothetical protein K7432_007913 [Basidiobolus ranarum]|uniref:Uncharacterized protein n=1 Tax=Basidiobolus ranarum TaxID=34480 RepID=A0ABR2WSK3_9FUNG